MEKERRGANARPRPRPRQGKASQGKPSQGKPRHHHPKQNSLGIKRLERRIDTAKLAVGNAGSVHGETGVRHGCWQCCLSEWGVVRDEQWKDKQTKRSHQSNSKANKEQRRRWQLLVPIKEGAAPGIGGSGSSLPPTIPSAPRMTHRGLDTNRQTVDGQIKGRRLLLS
jgi:hypothetical protein